MESYESIKAELTKVQSELEAVRKMPEDDVCTVYNVDDSGEVIQILRDMIYVLEGELIEYNYSDEYIDANGDYRQE